MHGDVTTLADTNEYKNKLRSAEDAVGLIKDGDHVVTPTGVGQPPTLLKALSDRRREFHNVTVNGILTMVPLDYYDDHDTQENVRHQSFFLGGFSRPGAQGGWIDYVPANYSELGWMLRNGEMPCDTVMTMASAMDDHGYFSISLAADYTMGAIDRARTVILEVNPNVPFAFGNNHVHISQVTAVVEDDRPVQEVGLPQIGDVEKAIGQYVADMIPDGANLQIGFGSIPDAVVMQLLNKRDLGVHTEMMGDGILSLIEAGVVTNLKKNFMPGRMSGTFALGSKKLYEWMHLNRTMEIHPVDWNNDPWIASRNDNLHTINGTIEIDFMGQCCSESLGAKPFSGTGGQTDFVRAGNRSAGGKSFIVLPSTAKNGTISRIRPTLAPGAHVTTSKNDVNYVVTEYGAAQLRGKSNRERARSLIKIAHPDFREELMDEAR
ncbi:MAG: acetyl-CoA hydrolase/transferase family protein [Austwickia sp.]|nr:acetyl-CoA hydrolase/transferase family protein [Austwickia sp.]